MAGKLEKLDISIVNSVTLGHYWGVTDRRVRQLKEEGIIEEVARGKYDLAQCTRRYCDFLRHQANANAGSKEVKLNLETEKALHEKAKREKAELQLQVMRGEVHLGSDVEEVMTDMITKAKMKLLALPAKAAPTLLGYKDINSIESELEKLINETLVELADYSPDLFINNEMILKDDADE